MNAHPLRRFVISLLAAALGAAACACVHAADEIVLVPERVSAHGWFFQGEAGMASAANKGFMSNAGFVVTGEGVVVFDALGTPELGRAMIDAIRKITHEPIKRVIVSHYHADHVYGLQPLQQAGAEIWALSEGRSVLHVRRGAGAPCAAPRRSLPVGRRAHARRGAGPVARRRRRFPPRRSDVPADLFGRRSFARRPDALRRRGSPALRGRPRFLGTHSVCRQRRQQGLAAGDRPHAGAFTGHRHPRPRPGVARRRTRSRADARLPRSSARRRWDARCRT